MTLCRDYAAVTMRAVNAEVESLIALLLVRITHDPTRSVWEQLPAGFDISSEGWHKAEAAIEEAIANDDNALTRQLCDEYQQRATRYVSQWRERIREQCSRERGTV